MLHARGSQSASVWLALLSMACVVVGCKGGGEGNGDGGGEPPATDGGCEVLTEAPLDCTPSFDPPEFTAIYDNVIEARCGTNSGSCHGRDAGSGLVMLDRETAYAHLSGAADGRPLVIPGHPECSELVWRVQSSDLRVRMPLNSPPPLTDGAICAIRHWIADGAEGP